MSDNRQISKMITLVAFVTIFALIFILWSDVSKLKSNSGADEIMTKFIYDHPELIEESIRRHEIAKMEKAQKDASEKIKEFKGELESADSPQIGAADADVTIVEFFDYSCGYCKIASKEIAKLVASDKKVRVIFKELPILSQMSNKAARSALAVFNTDKTKYEAYHQELMSIERISEQQIEALVKKYGFDFEKIKAEMNSQTVESQILKNHEIATKIMLRGTPTFIIEGEIYSGAIDSDSLASKIAQIRMARGQTPPQ